MNYPDLSGTVLAGKYRLEGLLGRGGMGSVWRAAHLGLHAPVAVKMLDLVGFSHNAESLNRFHREARAAAAIRSPHVVQILDHGVDETLGVPFIVMELMVGESLAQRLERAGRMPPDAAARVFTHVARALSRAHEAGIVHRDLKPDNVFLVWNEDEEVAKVLDFGIAKAQAHGMTTDSATRTGAVMGTAYYMSPEQISGKRDVDLRTDIWAYGVMACECLTGRRPFDADTIGGLTLAICIEPIPVPSSFAPVPDGFDAWFARAVNRDVSQRFQSAREAADALRLVCTGVAHAGTSSQPQFVQEGVHATTAPTGPRLVASTPTAGPLSLSADHAAAAMPKKSHGALLGVLLGVAAIVAVGAGLWLRHAKAEPNAEETPVTPSATAASAAQPAMKDPAVVPPVTVASEAPAPATSPAPSAGPPAAAEPSPQPKSVNPVVRVQPTPRAATPAAVTAAVAPAQAPTAAMVQPKPAAVNPKPATSKPSPAVRDVIDDRH